MVQVDTLAVDLEDVVRGHLRDDFVLRLLEDSADVPYESVREQTASRFDSLSIEKPGYLKTSANLETWVLKKNGPKARSRERDRALQLAVFVAMLAGADVSHGLLPALVEVRDPVLGSFVTALVTALVLIARRVCS